MADPAIQTFCCFNPGKRAKPALLALTEFNSLNYNTVCLVSSFIGMAGAIYQILHKKDYFHKHRLVSLLCGRGRKIILWLAFADLLASLGVFVRSIVKLNDNFVNRMDESDSTFLFCMIFSVWTQYFYCVTWMWTLCYTVDMCLAVRDRQSYPTIYHLFCWLLPAVLTAGGLTLLYYPNASCIDPTSQSLLDRVLPNYFATYLPVLAVMLANPLLYWHVAKHLQRVISSGLGQWTNKERSVVESVHRTFALVNVLFYICWLPNLISAVLVWIWPTPQLTFVVTLWYLMAIVNPLQAAFNCIVYSSFSSKMNVPWYPVDHPPIETTPLLSTNTSSDEGPL
ncbi:G-protein coupled receptor 143 [Nilaparvata lugens]|uniref:G-protein coupled receptor 143 n=1 Tax=Nilaparvata lugens TaxID=108931 RepID=UPI00193DC7F6|nr:G-protein coupled receptor 143 [Nilaparvata lugens]